MREILPFFAGLAILASAASAGPYDGLWRSNPTAECAFTRTDGGALKIENDVLFGVESRCEMTSPVNVRDMEAILYDMACASEETADPGEGDTAEPVTTAWTDRAMFLTAADGGLYLIWNGYAFKYERCDDDAAVGTVATAAEIGVTGEAAAVSTTD